MHQRRGSQQISQPEEDLKTVEIRRPDASHPWGICYAVLPDGPEILKIINESPAYGHLRSGQVIKTINGQSVLGLKREDIIELLNIDDEVVVLEVTQASTVDVKSVQFGREYGRGSVEPQGYTRGLRRNSEMSISSLTERRGSNACVAMPSNLPDCRGEFARIHQQRKQSREMTLKELQNLRNQRAASVDVYERERRRSSGARPQLPMGLPVKPDGLPVPKQTSSTLDALPETPREETNMGMSGLRYMGVHIPSRSFRALASLMGMDPSGADMDQIKPTSNEPCKTVIDVRATAEAMRQESLRRSSIDCNSSLPPQPPSNFPASSSSSVKAQ